MVTFLTEFLWVILIVLPNSTWQSTLPGHPTIFPTKLSSVLTVWWYPTCVLEFNHPYGFLNRSLLNTRETTLSYFRSLFKDHTRPIIIYRLSLSRRITFTKWIIFLFQRTSRTFPICFTKVRHFFDLSNTFFLFFYSVLGNHSFITDCQPNPELFYKVTTFFSLVKYFVNFF
jgi:hypothetical protein